MTSYNLGVFQLSLITSGESCCLSVRLTLASAQQLRQKPLINQPPSGLAYWRALEERNFIQL